MSDSNSVLFRPVASEPDVQALSSHDRVLLARWLADSAECTDVLPLRGRRQLGLAFTIVGTIFLIPWIAELSTSLPDQHAAHQWRLAWAGFDGALVLAFAFAAFAVWRRRQIAITALTVLGTLLLCDAWFDTTLSWGTGEHTASILTAIFVEIPAGIFVLALAHRLLREAVHYVWHLEGREHPVPPLRQLPMLFVRSESR